MYLSGKGYKIPQTGDRDFWSYLTFNWLRASAHSHDGVDSELLSPKNFSKGTAAIAAANWSSVSGQAGTYKQTLTVPAGYDVDKMQVKFYISTAGPQAGHEVLLSVRKVTSSTYDVFINDNTLDLVAIYG